MRRALRKRLVVDAMNEKTPVETMRTVRTTTPFGRAVKDLVDGLSRQSIWRTMAWQDILIRYRGSVLGPFWLTISMAVMVLALGALYSKLFKVNTTEYIPFLCLGIMMWNLISSIVIDACNCFVSGESIIKQVKMPFSIHVYRMIWRNLIIAAHNVVVYVGVLIYYGIWPTATMLLAIPALVIVILNGVWAGLLLGMMCARFRDVPQIIANLVQVVFFVTPVIWFPSLLGESEYLVYLNPFFAFVDLLRTPLLNATPSALSVGTALLMTVAGWGVTLALFSRFRSRISYWV